MAARAAMREKALNTGASQHRIHCQVVMLTFSLREMAMKTCRKQTKCDILGNTRDALIDLLFDLY